MYSIISIIMRAAFVNLIDFTLLGHVCFLLFTKARWPFPLVVYGKEERTEGDNLHTKTLYEVRCSTVWQGSTDVDG